MNSIKSYFDPLTAVEMFLITPPVLVVCIYHAPYVSVCMFSGENSLSTCMLGVESRLQA